MSWPQWPGGQPGIVQPPVINPAPNVVNPSANQYTPEQWAQMQHQNWQQWAQWQQQFQQWQQQYGAEYQKSMNAIAQASMPPQVSVPFVPAPPLPAENKPPPPPDEPVGPPPQSTNAPFAMNMPPPPASQSNYNTAPPPPHPPNMKPGFDNKYSTYRNNAPPTQGAFPNQDINNQQRFPRNQNYNARDLQGQNTNWHNQNRNQQGTNRYNQPLPRGPQFENKPESGTKRPYFNPNDNDNTKRNKMDLNEGNKWGGQQQQHKREEPLKGPSQQKPPTVPQAKSNPEELSEAEKKFDRQFNDWEAQFQKWKEQNANHPDKEQYRQYEKKWETWRAQLLERREQMKRKRLGLSATSPQQSVPNKPDQDQLTKNLTQPLGILNTNTEAAPTTGNVLISSKPETAEKLEVGNDVPAIRPPPNLNNQPLEFKKSGINIIESSDQEKENNKDILKSDDGHNDFLKSTASDGIPGLDLVEEGNNAQEVDVDSKKNENTKPDLEAISRGINSILGDQKLLNMLSLVSQNQTKAQQPPQKIDSPKFSPAEYVQEENEYSNEEHDEYFSFERPSSHDETPGNLARSDSQKDGENDYYNEEGSNSFEDSAHFAKGPDNLHQFSGSGPRNLEKQNFNRNQNIMQDPNRDANSFNRGPGNTNFGNSAIFNRMDDNYDQADRDFDNLSRGSFNKSRNPPNFGREPNQFNRGSDNFSQDADDFNRPPNNFNKGPDGFNRGSDNFNNFNRGPRNTDNYNRGPDNFNRGPDNFNRGPDNFTRGPDKFNRGPANFNRGPDNFNRHSDNFNRGPDNFNRSPANFRGHDNFNRGPDNFNRGPGGFNRGTDNFNRGHESFNRGPDNFNRGSENFSKPSDAFTRGPVNFRGSDNFSRDNDRGPDDISRGVDDLSKGPDSFKGDPDNFDEESESFRDADNFDRAPDTFNRGFDNFNRGGDKLTRTPDNFNRGLDNFGRPSDNFSRGPDNFNRPGNFNRGPDNFGRGPDNFTRVPNNFNRDGRNVDNFNKGSDNINRSFENRNFDNFNRGPPNLDKGQIHLGRGSVDFNREADEFGRTTNFNREFGNFDKNLDDDFSSGLENFSSRGSANRPALQSNRPLDRDIGSFDDYKKHSVVSPGNFDKGSNNFARDLMPLIKKPEFTEDSSFNQNKQFNVKEDEFETNSWKNNIPRNESTFDAKLDSKSNVSGINDDCDSNTFGRNSEDLNMGPTKRNVNAELQFEHPNSIRGSSPSASVPEKVQAQSGHSEGDGMWKTSNVIDYGHKSLADEPEIILEVYHTFDYRHKPLNRIPYPSRPKWLSQMVENYPEFGIGRNSRHDSRKYPSNEKFDTYNMYDDRGKTPYDDWSRRTVGDRDKYTDRDRKFNEDRKRKSYDNREHHIYEEKERHVKEYRSDKSRRGFDRDGGVFNEEKDKAFEESCKSHNFDEQKSTDSKASFSKGDHFDDEDFENEDNFSSNSKHSESVNVGSDKQNKPKHTNKNNTTPTTAAKSNITSIEDILTPPGRYNRAPRIVIILRGPPGSGKSFLAKLIKDKEVENGGSAPRILCLDDYFMVEQEKEVEEDGRKTKIKEMVYEYEEDMEASYRQSLMKSFKKTITDGYFTFIIVDNINDKVKYFGEMWSFAKQNGFQVYISQMELDVQNCTKRNIHGRTETEIEKCVAGWEQTPSHHPVLDATSLIQSGSIPEVEMEEINSPSSDNMNEEERLISSKWDTFDYSVDNLAKLDGTNKPLRTSRTMEDYLQLDDDWIQPVSTKPGQKRVRWADLEERKEQEKMRAIGFVVGQTNWDRMMDPTMGGSALTQTKYIERYSKY